MNTYTFDLGIEKIVAVGEKSNSDNEFFKVIANGKTVAIVKFEKVNYILVNHNG